MKKIKLSVLVLILLCNLVSCEKTTPNQDSDEISEMTILIILEANNDLKREAFLNINDMEFGLPEVHNSNVLVLLRANDHKSTLLELKHDKNLNIINSDTIEIIHHDLSTAENLGEVANLVQKKFPAKNYGLLLWSHATSWAPPNELNQVSTKSFGFDRGHEMDIQDLANSLPKNYEYIIFDACNMSSIEVLYEFKDHSKYILASPTEVISTGFPYREIMTDLIMSDLKSVADKYYSFYNQLTGLHRSATVSVIRSSELSGVANAFRNALSSDPNRNVFERKSVQRLDFTYGFPVSTYDFGNYISVNFDKYHEEMIGKEIEKCVIFKRNTEHYFNNPITDFSGLTCFIPFKESPHIEYYKSLSWVVDTGLDKQIARLFSD